MWFSSGKEIRRRLEGCAMFYGEEAESTLQVSFTRVSRYESRPYGQGDVYEICDEIEDEEYEWNGELIGYGDLVGMLGPEARDLIDQAIMVAE